MLIEHIESLLDHSKIGSHQSHKRIKLHNSSRLLLLLKLLLLSYCAGGCCCNTTTLGLLLSRLISFTEKRVEKRLLLRELLLFY